MTYTVIDRHTVQYRRGVADVSCFDPSRFVLRLRDGTHDDSDIREMVKSKKPREAFYVLNDRIEPKPDWVPPPPEEIKAADAPPVESPAPAVEVPAPIEPVPVEVPAPIEPPAPPVAEPTPAPVEAPEPATPQETAQPAVTDAPDAAAASDKMDLAPLAVVISVYAAVVGTVGLLVAVIR